jgi:hypothetical protein
MHSPGPFLILQIMRWVKRALTNLSLVENSKAARLCKFYPQEGCQDVDLGAGVGGANCSRLRELGGAASPRDLSTFESLGTLGGNGRRQRECEIEVKIIAK